MRYTRYQTSSAVKQVMLQLRKVPVGKVAIEIHNNSAGTEMLTRGSELKVICSYHGLLVRKVSEWGPMAAVR